MVDRFLLICELRRRIPEAKREHIDDCVDDAYGFISAYTGREEVPKELKYAMLRVAMVYYNRLGIEGESSHSEGGVSRTMQGMPEDILQQLRPWRQIKVVSMR